MTAAPATLLPPNATPFERAAEATIAARQGLPADLVSAGLDPARCAEALLPFLAWDLGVDIWDSAWPIEKKRYVLTIAWQLQRLKSTPAGIRAHVALTGATVEKIVRPPARGFLRGAQTEAQRIAWMEGLPQVRIYPFLHGGEMRPGQAFLSGGTGKRFWRQPSPRVALGIDAGEGVPLGGTIAGGSGPMAFLRPSRGSVLMGRRATWYDRGRETDVTLELPTGDLVERVNIARTDAHRPFWSHCFHGRFALTESTAEQRVLTVRPAAESAGEMFAVPPGSQVTDVRPHRVSQRRTAPPGRAFWARGHRFHGRRFLETSFGAHMVYDCYYVIDPARVGPRQQATMWHGHGQYGIDPFTAKLRIAVPMQRARPRAHKWYGNGHLRAASMVPLGKAIAAVSAAKALRDTIFIDTTTRSRAQFGSGLRFGDFSFGEIRKAS